MKHKHHIIPKHMGGTDDPSNLIELSVEEHAEAHKVLFEEYGLKEDEIAWKGLAGIIGREEVVKSAQILGSKKGGNSPKNPFKDPEFQQKMEWTRTPERMKVLGEKAHSQAASIKRKDTFKKIEHSQGKNNSQFGRIWISNTVTKEIRRIDIDDVIPEGWVRGKKGHVSKRLWVNNNSKEYYVLLEQAEKYILEGFNKGRLKTSMPKKESARNGNCG